MERLCGRNVDNVGVTFFVDYKGRMLIMETNYFLDIEEMEEYYGFEPIYKEEEFESKNQN